MEEERGEVLFVENEAKLFILLIIVVAIIMFTVIIHCIGQQNLLVPDLPIRL